MPEYTKGTEIVGGAIVTGNIEVIGNALFDRKVIDANAATRDLEAVDSGSLIMFNRAAGVDVTLPAAAAGLWFEFVVKLSVTTNDYSITAEAGDLLLGGLFSIDTDTSNAIAYFAPDATDDLIISMNGTTTGGLLGSRIRVEAADDARWFVSGVNKGSGIVATPFS